MVAWACVRCVHVLIFALPLPPPSSPFAPVSEFNTFCTLLTTIIAPISVSTLTFIITNVLICRRSGGVGGRMPSKPTIATDAKITLTSPSELHAHFDELYDDLHAAETEHTWQKIERALLHIQAITRGGAAKFANFVSLLKENAAPVNNALLSERTKLSGTAGDLLNSIAPRLAERFEPLVPVFVPTLLLICARTNKVAVKRAEKTLYFVVKHCRPPSVVPYLKEAVKDKGQGLRAVAAGTLVLVLEFTDKDRLARRVADIEASIKSGATDSNPEVRQTTKRLFELYVAVWPERVEHFTKPMTPTIRRYLSLPKTGALHVDVPPLTTAPASALTSASAARSHTQPSRHDEAPLPAAAHASTSRAAPAYNFFPDLKTSTSSSSATFSAARMPSAPAGFSVNDATYAKRGLFAEQIAAARNARLARVPSFNFDDTAKASTETAPVPMMKRQPSYEQLRSHGSAASGATFRVPRFDVVPSRQDSDAARPRSGHGYESAAHMHGDINANAPSFAAASGLHGKNALLAAYKQAFAGDVLTAKPTSSSSRERHHRDRSEKSAKQSDRRREKTVTVRFEPESDDKEGEARHGTGTNDEIRRSKSAPQTAVQTEATSAATPDVDVVTPTEADKGHKGLQTDESKQRSAPKRFTEPVDSDDEDDDERPSTPPERMLHAQTPRTGVKASRVPAQRVAMPSAVKVSAMRVAVPTPSAKIAASRVANVPDSVESSPVPKARAEPSVAQVQPIVADAALAPAKNQEDAKEKVLEKEKTTTKEDEKDQQPEVKKPAPSAVQTAKQTAKPVSAKTAPSASLAAKARLEARTAKPASSTTTTAVKKVVPKVASTVPKLTVVRKPVSSSTTTLSKPTTKPPTQAASSIKTSKPAPPLKPSTTAPSATARAKPAAPSVAPSTTLAAKKIDSAAAARTSRLTASTASTRNKIVPAASVKKFQPTKPSSLPSSSLAAKTRPKSSIAASLTAKSKLVGPQAAASDKANAVRKASVTMAARIEKHRRVSAAAVPPLPSPAPAMLSEPAATEDAAELVEQGHVAKEPLPDTELSATGRAEEVSAQVDGSEKDTAVDAVVDENVTAAETEAEAATSDMADHVDQEPSVNTVPVSESTSGRSLSDERSQEVNVVETSAEPAAQESSLDEVSPTTDKVTAEEEEERPQIEAQEQTTSSASPVQTPIRAVVETPAKVRTPLGSKDTNLPKVTPLSIKVMEKTAPSSSPSHIRTEARITPAQSPLRRSATPKSVSRIPQFEAESSFEESESESDMEDEADEVVQLHFRPRPPMHGTDSPVAKRHPVMVVNRQLVLGVDSSDDASMIEADGNDETVLLEEPVA